MEFLEIETENKKNSMTDPPLTTEEIAALENLRSRIQDLICQNEDFDYDFYLIHWLRVQKYNVDKTENMIRASVQWRAENNIEQLVNEDVDPRIDEKFHVDIDGMTKDGYPVFCANAGAFRVGKAISKFGKEALFRQWYQLTAKMERKILDARFKMDNQRNLKTASYAKSWLLLNMTDLALMEMLSIDVITGLATAFRNVVRYFPMVSGNICCVNVNQFFAIAFKVISPILKGSNITIHVFGTNEEKWKAFVFDTIHPDQIQLILEPKIEKV